MYFYMCVCVQCLLRFFLNYLFSSFFCVCRYVEDDCDNLNEVHKNNNNGNDNISECSGSNDNSTTIDNIT